MLIVNYDLHYLFILTTVKYETIKFNNLQQKYTHYIITKSNNTHLSYNNNHLIECDGKIDHQIVVTDLKQKNIPY